MVGIRHKKAPTAKLRTQRVEIKVAMADQMTMWKTLETLK
jgi:hypothetical protein